MDEFQLEELQKSNQQVQDRSPYSPGYAARFPGGYTPVGLGEDNTPEENSATFSKENPVNHTHITYNWEQDNDSFLDYIDQPVFSHEVPEIPYVDHYDDVNDYSSYNDYHGHEF